MVKLKRLYFGVFQLLMVRKTIILIHPLTKNCRTWHRNQCNNFQLSERTHPPIQRPKISLFIALNQAIPHNKLWLYSNLPQFDIYQKSATFWAAFRQQGAIMEVTSDSRLWHTVLYRRKSEDTNLTSHTSKTIVTLVWALRNDQPMCQHDGANETHYTSKKTLWPGSTKQWKHATCCLYKWCWPVLWQLRIQHGWRLPTLCLTFDLPLFTRRMFTDTDVTDVLQTIEQLNYS